MLLELASHGISGIFALTSLSFSPIRTNPCPFFHVTELAQRLASQQRKSKNCAEESFRISLAEAEMTVSLLLLRSAIDFLQFRIPELPFIPLFRLIPIRLRSICTSKLLSRDFFSHVYHHHQNLTSPGLFC